MVQDTHRMLDEIRRALPLIDGSCAKPDKRPLIRDLKAAHKWNKLQFEATRGADEIRPTCQE